MTPNKFSSCLGLTHCLVVQQSCITPLGTFSISKDSLNLSDVIVSCTFIQWPLTTFSSFPFPFPFSSCPGLPYKRKCMDEVLHCPDSTKSSLSLLKLLYLSDRNCPASNYCYIPPEKSLLCEYFLQCHTHLSSEINHKQYHLHCH